MRFFVFSTMKAGTMFLHQLLADIAQQGQITHYSLNYPQDSPFHLPSENKADLANLVNKEGCYGPFRHYFPVPKADDVRVILHFRDPRDVLTSMYFYLAYHQKFIPQEVRDTYIKRGIDRFVFSPRLPESKSWQQRTKQRVKRVLNLDNPPTITDWFLQDYQMYFDQYMGWEETTVITYEEMVTDFSSWLPKFLSALSLEDQPQLLQQLLAAHKDSFTPPNPDSLDKIKHKRKIVPGDHKQQMSTQTITKLNNIFSKQLSAIGYQP